MCADEYEEMERRQRREERRMRRKRGSEDDSLRGKSVEERIQADDRAFWEPSGPPSVPPLERIEKRLSELRVEMHGEFSALAGTVERRMSAADRRLDVAGSQQQETISQLRDLGREARALNAVVSGMLAKLMEILERQGKDQAQITQTLLQLDAAIGTTQVMIEDLGVDLGVREIGQDGEVRKRESETDSLTDAQVNRALLGLGGAGELRSAGEAYAPVATDRVTSVQAQVSDEAKAKGLGSYSDPPGPGTAKRTNACQGNANQEFEEGVDVGFVQGYMQGQGMGKGRTGRTGQRKRAEAGGRGKQERTDR